MNYRNDFPIFNRSINGKPLIYLDSAATTQKPGGVIDAIANFYAYHNANIHRGIYTLAEEATTMYENVRKQVAQFIGAQDAKEIVFTKGTTEAINLVAASWARHALQAGDEILLTEMEHHANLLPWQQLAQEKNLILKFIPVLEHGMLDLDALDHLLTTRTKLVSVVHVSHVLGTHNNIDLIIKRAHDLGAKVLIDAAQSIPHQKINVTEISCDFLVFSGHKMLGPTGVGVLYVNTALHESMRPYQCGGGMVFDASYLHARFLPVPYRLEAGTPPIAQVIGLGAAMTYLETINMSELQKHGAMLCAQLIEGLAKIQGIKILGPVEQLKRQGHVVSFVVDDMHAHDVAAYLDRYGICVRAGHHCAQPFAKKMGIDASVRVSFYLYNEMSEVDYVLDLLRLLRKSV